MKIQVTQQHIDSGVRGSCTSDPIALALKEAGFPKVWAGVRYLRIYDGPEFADHSMPDEVYEFLRLYDNGLPTLPMCFDLEF